ncbi:MAG: DUF4190 domain-containing protein [Phycisphaerales bacterium]|nr:DUF4190 domain-containing protein [Phycisphaerales bacterium]
MNYAQFDSSAPVDIYAEPERTSIAAILSLVLGFLGCCLGITSLPSVLLGIFAIMKIKSSKGRVGGMGLAIAGLLVGLMTLMIWIGVLIGSNWVWANVFDKQIISPTTQVLIDIEADNFDAARAGLGSPAADVSDAELIAFREAYQSTLGDYVSKPDGLISYIKGLMSVGQTMNSVQPPPGMMPFTLNFENGTAVLIPTTIQNRNTGQYESPTEILLIDMNGEVIKLPADPILPD